MGTVFDVNNDAAIELTAKLERLSRSAFPSAVRNTLNNAAFETKKNVPKVAANKFVTRQKSFFRKMSLVDKAKGFEVESMVATTGINKSINPALAKNLESQEVGGTIRGRKLIPHDHSRTSKNNARKVSSRNHINKIKAHNASKAFRAHRGTRGSKFVAAVMSTAKAGKRHMMLKSGSTGMVYEVNAISQNRRTRKVNFKIKKLYNVRNTKTHRVSAKGFMKKSAETASKNMNKNFKNNAEFQFKKILK